MSYADLIAIPSNAENELRALTCDGDIGCPECAPSYPEGAEAICDAGSCKVIIYDF